MFTQMIANYYYYYDYYFQNIYLRSLSQEKTHVDLIKISIGCLFIFIAVLEKLGDIKTMFNLLFHLNNIFVVCWWTFQVHISLTIMYFRYYPVQPDI